MVNPLLAAALTIYLITTPAVGPVHNYHQPDDVIADQVNCDQWERIDSEAWRTETYAVVTFFNGPTVILHNTDVTQTYADDLFWTLEDSCYHEQYGGW